MMDALNHEDIRKLLNIPEHGVIFEEGDEVYPFSEAVIDGTLDKCIRALVKSESISYEEAGAKLRCASARVATLLSKYGE